MRRLAPTLCALLLVGALVAPAAARPPPRDVSGFAGGLDGGPAPHYPPSSVSDVTIDVAVYANGTTAWTERATLTNADTVDALRANDTLRHAVVVSRFAHRFGHDTASLTSHLDGDALVVTYRLDGVGHRAPGGGVLLAPFADYRNDYEPGRADVTIHAPDGYRVVDHPTAMARTGSGGALRWNASTGAGDAGVSPGLVTFAPAGALFPSLRAELAVSGAYGRSTLGLGAGYALLFGVPLALVTSAGAALVSQRRRIVSGVGFGTVLLVGLGAAATHYPATESVVGRAFHPFFLTFAVPLAAAVAFVGLGVHAARQWIVPDR